jgi:hypothetical protein
MTAQQRMGTTVWLSYYSKSAKWRMQVEKMVRMEIQYLSTILLINVLTKAVIDE